MPNTDKLRMLYEHVCNVCGADLDAEWDDNGIRRYISVKPCEKCLANEFGEGVRRGAEVWRLKSNSVCR
jgi:hypothetical protein